MYIYIYKIKKDLNKHYIIKIFLKINQVML